jgi:hypothetical protein
MLTTHCAERLQCLAHCTPHMPSPHAELLHAHTNHIHALSCCNAEHTLQHTSPALHPPHYQCTVKL